MSTRNASLPKNRREFLRTGAAAASVAAFPFPAIAQSAPRVVVIGGGFAGASCARAIRKLEPKIAVTLVEPNPVFTACPFSNGVIAGLRNLLQQQFGYDGVRRDGVVVAQIAATAVDGAARSVTLADGNTLFYDRLVMAPGIDINWAALPGYTEQAAEIMPHAWKAGAQTELLRRQLEAMDDGGVVVISAPDNPFRCPPGPYERASLIAWYLKTRKPRSKLIVLDAKDNFSLQRLFRPAWEQLYPDIVKWVPQSEGGTVTRVDAGKMQVETDFETFKVDVANIVPPQQAGRIAAVAGVADKTGWCPIDPVTFESRLVPGIHIVGDAAIGGGMAKSAYGATDQGRACAAAIIGLMFGRKPMESELTNSCFSLAAPDVAFSTWGRYRPRDGLLAEIEGSGGSERMDVAKAEALFARMTKDAFG